MKTIVANSFGYFNWIFSNISERLWQGDIDCNQKTLRLQFSLYGALLTSCYFKGTKFCGFRGLGGLP